MFFYDLIFYQYMKRLFFLAILLVVSSPCAARDVQYIQAISNPHAQESSEVCMAGEECPLVGALDVTRVLNAPIATQSDTFMGVVHKRFQGVEVEKYFNTICLIFQQLHIDSACRFQIGSDLSLQAT